MIETNRIEPVPVSGTGSREMVELEDECCRQDDFLKETEFFTASWRVLKEDGTRVDCCFS